MIRRMLRRVRSKARKLLQGERQLALDPGIAADGGNGFGARKLLRSARPSGIWQTHSTSSLCLADVQLLTRFCALEKPYWSSFLAHYQSLGVRIVHACVQSEADANFVELSGHPSEIDVRVHRIHASLTPDAAWQRLDLTPLAQSAHYTLLLDCDEYVHPLRPDVSVNQLFGMFPEVAQLYLPWNMRPVLQTSDHKSGGFWGHVGKPIVRSDNMTAIASDHGFYVDHADPRFASAPVGLFGLSLVHYWSRSFRDCLIKTFQNRFDDAKSVDRDVAHDLIQSGELPVRLRVLAYLMLQQGYLPTPVSPFASVDHAVEDQLVRASISKSDEEFCWQLFDQYRQHLAQRLIEFPLYPAATLLHIAQRLPSLSELKASN